MRSAVLGFSLVSLASQAAAVEYKVYDLGAFPGFGNQESYAMAVNDSGLVVGNANGSVGFKWTVSGGLKMVTPMSYLACTAESFGLSPSGHVVGQFRSFMTGGSMGYLRLANGSLILIPPPFPGKITPYAVNDSFQVVGSYSGVTHIRAFIWTATSGVQDIGSLFPGSQTEAKAINKNGQVVGYSGISGPANRGFLWSPSLGMIQLDPWPGQTDSECVGINDAGDAVVHSYSLFSPERTHIRMSNGSLRVLVFPGRYLDGLCINNRGDVAGVSSASDQQNRAFFFRSGGEPILVEQNLDSDSSGWRLYNVNGMNDLGWLAGVGNRGGHDRAFLAIPHENLPGKPNKRFLPIR